MTPRITYKPLGEKRHGHNSIKRSNHSIMIQSNYYLGILCRTKPFHLFLLQYLHGITVLHVRNLRPRGHLSFIHLFIQQTFTKHPCTSLGARDPLWPKEISSLPFWHIFKHENGLGLNAGFLLSARGDFPRLCGVELFHLLAVRLWDNSWTYLSLHVHICKIEIMIVPASWVAGKFREYGDAWPRIWAAHRSVVTTVLQQLCRSGTGKDLFPLEKGRREAPGSGVSLTWALGLVSILEKLCIPSVRRDSTEAHVLCNDLISSLEFILKPVSFNQHIWKVSVRFIKKRS